MMIFGFIDHKKAKVKPAKDYGKKLRSWQAVSLARSSA